MNIVDRVKKILIQPKQEWAVVAQESTSPADLYRSYIVPLAAIGPLASLIGVTLIGVSIPFAGTYRVPIGSGIAMALVSYVLALVGVFVVALIVNALAPTFGGEKDQTQALKVVAYASTPGWVAGILQVIPMLGLIALLISFYGIYLLYLGLPAVMRSQPGKAGTYTAVVVLCAFVLSIIIGFLTSFGSSTPPAGSPAAGGSAPLAALSLNGLAAGKAAGVKKAG
jgi:hypothetical protein